MKRYVREIKKISFAKALDRRRSELEDFQMRVAALEAEIRKWIETPPQTEFEFQREILPGEVGYESASPIFDPKYYIGDVEWKK